MNKEELIIKYFESELNQEEMKEFRYLVDHDAEFKKDVGFRENLKTAITGVERKKLKNYLRGLDDEDFGQPRTRTMSYYLYGVAAAVILLVAVAYLFNLNKDQTSTYLREDILALYEPYPNVITPNLRDNPGEIDQQKAAFIAYERGDYQMADSLFTRLLPTGDHIRFYKGIAKFELSEYDSAAVLFEQYIKSDNPQFFDQSLWYLSLSNLLRGELDAAKENLSLLKRRGKYKNTESERLLPKL